MGEGAGLSWLHALRAIFAFEISDLQRHGRDEDSRAFEKLKMVLY